MKIIRNGVITVGSLLALAMLFPSSRGVLAEGVVNLPRAATSTILGLVKPDGTTITNTAGAIAAASTTVNGTTCTPGSSCTISGLTSNVVNSTYDLSTASGNKDITGFGFNPTSAVISYGIANAFGSGTGFIGGVATQGSTSVDTTAGTTVFRQTAQALFISNLAVNAFQGCTASFITDGIRLACTKTGSPTGTLGISVLGQK